MNENLKNKLESISANVARIDGIVNSLQSVDMMGRPRPDAVTFLTHSLKAMLSFQHAIKLTDELQNETRSVVNSLMPGCTVKSRYRSKYSGWGSSSGSIERITPEIDVDLPNPSDIKAVTPVIGAVNDVLRRLAETYSVWGGRNGVLRSEFAANDQFYYSQKAVLPYGAREAISILRVWAEKKLDKNYTDQEHEIYGMQFRLSQEQAKNVRAVLRKLRRAKRSTGIAIERKGRAPSWAAGVRSLKRRNSPSIRVVAGKSDRMISVIWDTIRRHKVRLPTVLGGGGVPDSVHIFNLLRGDESARTHRKLVRWVHSRIHAEMQCNPGAVLTGDPQQVNETDYIVPAAWESRGGVERAGMLYFRVGYNNCYHATEREYQQHMQQDGGIGNVVRSLLADRAERHLRYQRDQKQSYEIRRRNERKRTADIVRKLRALAVAGIELTPSDSYAVSNCRPGTAEFMERLGIDTTRIGARDILTKWRASSYIQRELFGRVVEKLANNPPSYSATTSPAETTISAGEVW